MTDLPVQDDTPEELAARQFRERSRLLRSLASVIIGIDLMMIGVVICVVVFALGARPLSGNAGMVAGIPIVSVIAWVLFVLAILLSLIVQPIFWKRGAEHVRNTPPEVPEYGVAPADLNERMWNVYAKGRFVEIAFVETAIVAIALLFHLTADWQMIYLICGLMLYLLIRFPSHARACNWHREHGIAFESEFD